MKSLLAIGLASAALALPSPAAQAADVNQYKVVHGVAVYLGVAAAQSIQTRPAGPWETSMHGGVPNEKNAYHVMVALFDQATGKRITGARVEAMVGELGLGGQRKAMEPMGLAGTETYGNYFVLRQPGIYQIFVKIAGVAGKPGLSTDFAFTR